MLIADWIALGTVVLSFIFGLAFGFGKGLKFFTKGIFGIIISIFICYCLGGLILQLGFVQELLNKFVQALEGKGGFCDFLLKIHIEIVVYYILLFIVVQIVRIIIVAIIKNVVEIDNIVFRLVNKILGMALFFGVFVLLALFIFQLVNWVGGQSAQDMAEWLTGSVFKLDKLFENNPLNSLPQRM